MSRLADEGNLSALKDYIAQYENSLTVTAPVRICKSDALNALFNHYRQQAIENDVDINWRIDLPDKSKNLDVDLCSIFGNILENAIDGCCTVEEGKRYFNLTSEIKRRLFVHCFNKQLRQAFGNGRRNLFVHKASGQGHRASLHEEHNRSL